MPATIKESIVIRAAPERVFELRANIENLPRYNRDVVGLRREGDGWCFRVKVIPGIGFPSRLTVRESEPPRRLVFAMTALIDAVEVCTFEPVEGGTLLRFELQLDSPDGLLGRIVDRLFAVPGARRQVLAELAKMKELLEAE